VTDHGPGLPKAELHKLFGRFEQLRSTDGKQRPGSGLGLAIAKAIVEQHGGQIGVEQPEEGGSTFWFSLPLALDEDEDKDGEGGRAVQLKTVTSPGQTLPNSVEPLRVKMLSVNTAEAPPPVPETTAKNLESLMVPGKEVNSMPKDLTSEQGNSVAGPTTMSPVSSLSAELPARKNQPGQTDSFRPPKSKKSKKSRR
jgi:hypothetical protein